MSNDENLGTAIDQGAVSPEDDHQILSDDLSDIEPNFFLSSKTSKEQIGNATTMRKNHMPP